MLFAERFHSRLASGEIDLTFRAWKRPQAKVGGRYRVGNVDLVVDDITAVSAAEVTDSDARRCGFDDAAAMRAAFGWADETRLLRIAFHAEAPAPARAVPSLDDEAITVKLDRLDASGPWTRATLEIIAARPAVRAGDLAAALGRDRLSFKADVRKLKRLGLTESLDIGYRLSARGEAYLRATSP